MKEKIGFGEKRLDRDSVSMYIINMKHELSGLTVDELKAEETRLATRLAFDFDLSGWATGYADRLKAVRAELAKR